MSTFGTRPFDEEGKKLTKELLQTKLGGEHLARREGGGQGAQVYVEGWKAIELANSIFGFEGWSCSVLELTPDFIEETQRGRVRVGVTAVVKIELKDGTFHSDVGFGSSEQAKKGKAIEIAKKEAVTDARKRALRFFGEALGNSIYDKTHTKSVSVNKISAGALSYAGLRTGATVINKKKAPSFVANEGDKKPLTNPTNPPNTTTSINTPTPNVTPSTSSSNVPPSSNTFPQNTNTSNWNNKMQPNNNTPYTNPNNTLPQRTYQAYEPFPNPQTNSHVNTQNTSQPNPQSFQQPSSLYNQPNSAPYIKSEVNPPQPANPPASKFAFDDSFDEAALLSLASEEAHIDQQAQQNQQPYPTPHPQQNQDLYPQQNQNQDLNPSTSNPSYLYQDSSVPPSSQPPQQDQQAYNNYSSPQQPRQAFPTSSPNQHSSPQPQYQSPQNQHSSPPMSHQPYQGTYQSPQTPSPTNYGYPPPQQQDGTPPDKKRKFSPVDVAA